MTKFGTYDGEVCRRRFQTAMFGTGQVPNLPDSGKRQRGRSGTRLTAKNVKITSRLKTSWRLHASSCNPQTDVNPRHLGHHRHIRYFMTRWDLLEDDIRLQ